MEQLSLTNFGHYFCLGVKRWWLPNLKVHSCKLQEAVYVTNGNPSFCLALGLIGAHFQGKIQHFGDVMSKKSSVDQSELRKEAVSDCKTNYMTRNINNKP